MEEITYKKMNINLSQQDINFIICTIGMIILAIMMTYTLNRVQDAMDGKIKMSKQEKINITNVYRQISSNKKVSPQNLFIPP